MGIYLGINMSLPFKQVFSSTLNNHGCACMKKSSSHIASSTSRFFHLTKYSIISQF
jgi:hypothetical protein